MNERLPFIINPPPLDYHPLRQVAPLPDLPLSCAALLDKPIEFVTREPAFVRASNRSQKRKRHEPQDELPPDTDPESAGERRRRRNREHARQARLRAKREREELERKNTVLLDYVQKQRETMKKMADVYRELKARVAPYENTTQSAPSPPPPLPDAAKEK